MNDEGLQEREGTAEDIAVSRYYYDTVDGERGHVDFDGRLLISEAVAVKSTAGIGARDMLERVSEMDPEALRALVWMVRKFRGADRDTPPEQDLRLLRVDFDLTSMRMLNLDANGVRVLVPPPPPPDPERVSAVTAALLAELPRLDTKRAAALAAIAVDATDDPEGEGPAGDEPAPGNTSPTTSN